MASQEVVAPTKIQKPPMVWHSEAREWFMAGIPVLAVSLLLIAAILYTRLWELDSPLRLIPWAFGLVAFIIAGMGAVFCIQGFIRRENPALLIRKVKGEQVAHHIREFLKERFEIMEEELKVWPNLGYWVGITCLTIKTRADKVQPEDHGKEKMVAKKKADVVENNMDGTDGSGETRSEGVSETGSQSPVVRLDIKEVWLHRSQTHTSLSVLHGTQLALSTSRQGGDRMNETNAGSKVELTRFLHEVQEHLEPVATELELEGRLIIH